MKIGKFLSGLQAQRRPLLGLYALIFILQGTLAVQPVQGADLRQHSKAVIKLFVTRQAWNMSQPWSKNPVSSSVCSGFLIAEGILTNAHCVTDATYIQMEVPGIAEKQEVRIEDMNHQVDLALLKPLHEGLLEGIVPIEFGDLPILREKVVTIGYPVGGRQVSYTEGVVSRIDMMSYAHSKLSNLMVQTDAAINSGNSGGPVFSDETGNCLGVATQVGNGNSIGYFIPVPVVRHFLKDLEDGEINGIPKVGVFVQTLENPANRAFLGMKEGQSGVRVKKIARYSTARKVLQVDDVLLSIDGHNIFNDGRVPFRESGKIGLNYYITTKQIGDNLDFRILRNNKERNVTIRLASEEVMVIPRMPRFDEQPPYYEIGGIVFRVVERRNVGKNTPASIKSYYDMTRGEDGLEELVVIGSIYEDDVNKGYINSVRNLRVKEINGKAISGLDDVSRAFENNRRGRYHTIVLVDGQKIILDRKQVKAREAEIRRRYNISPYGESE